MLLVERSHARVADYSNTDKVRPGGDPGQVRHSRSYVSNAKHQDPCSCLTRGGDLIRARADWGSVHLPW